MSFDVLVIGGGLAGSIAALAAAKSGARVALANRSWGATAMSTGALDIAYTPASSPEFTRPRTVIEHMSEIAAQRARHPYAVLGVERARRSITSAYTLLSAALEPAGLAPSPLHFDAHSLGLPSSLGVVIPAAAAMAPHAGVDFTKASRGAWVVAGLSGDAAFDPRRVALGVAADAAAFDGTRPAIEPARLDVDGRAASIALARHFDDAALVDALGEELVRCARGAAGIIVPPVLGLRRHAEVRASLTARVGVPVVEALAHLPSVPGVRLQLALEAALRASAVSLLGEVKDPEIAGGRVQSVLTAGGAHIAASAFILASGRFVSGGITWTDRCREALFGLPVTSDLGPMEDDNPSAVVRESPRESHPLMTTGVAVSRRVEPLAEGRVAYANLFAAGMVIGGFASRYALCADGVALATGWLAARAALGEANDA